MRTIEVFNYVDASSVNFASHWLSFCKKLMKKMHREKEKERKGERAKKKTTMKTQKNFAFYVLHALRR